MASTTLTPGPRLALGTLDVNKHLGQSPAAGSPKKHSASLIHENKQSMAATKETRSPARSVSPELESNASDRSPLGSSKRKARDDDEDARRAKFARLESDHEDLHDLSVQYMSDEKENTPNIQLDDPQALAAVSLFSGSKPLEAQLPPENKLLSCNIFLISLQSAMASTDMCVVLSRNTSTFTFAITVLHLRYCR